MTTTERIKNILRASHAARNSDFELWLIFAQKSGLELSERQLDIIKNMPSFETIRRTRQKIQQEGRAWEKVHGRKSPFTADPEVDKARYNKAVEVRQGINDEDPEKLLEARGYTILPFGQ